MARASSSPWRCLCRRVQIPLLPLLALTALALRAILVPVIVCSEQDVEEQRQPARQVPSSHPSRKKTGSAPVGSPRRPKAAKASNSKPSRSAGSARHSQPADSASRELSDDEETARKSKDSSRKQTNSVPSDATEHEKPGDTDSETEEVDDKSSKEAPTLEAGSRSEDRQVNDEAQSDAEVWIFCAPQWQECTCPGKVRWGNKDKWLEIPLVKGKEQHVKCSIDKLEDVAPGDDGKHCECALIPGSEIFARTNPAVLPADSAGTSHARLIASCEIFEKESASGTKWDTIHSEAVSNLCSFSDSMPKAGPKALQESMSRDLMRAWVDPKFIGNYERLFDQTGWTEYAFLNHFAGSPESRFAKETEQLIRSVHLFSEKPIVVVSFGMSTPSKWTPTRFDRLVLLHAPPLPAEPFRSFHFNKLRAMLMARIRVGVQLDSDQFVAPGVDRMFRLTAAEITEDYPMPIMPVHFLDRNPHDELSIGNRVKYWPRWCPGGKRTCKWQTLRWGHAHPTWTYWALPFLGRWLRSNFRDETLKKSEEKVAMRVLDVPEDEDLLNVAMWEDGATKQWCKFDVPGPTDFEGWLASQPGMDILGEKRFHPNGAPKVFYTAHGATNPDQSAQYIDRIAAKHKAGGLPAPIVFKGGFYKDGDELREDHPDITCLI